MSDSATVIASFVKNSREEVRIALDAFKGIDLVDVRVFADTTGAVDRVPTKKGISIKLATLPVLIAGLKAAEAEARRRGLLSPETGEPEQSDGSA